MGWKNSNPLSGFKLWQGAAVVLFLALAFAFFAFSSGHAAVQPAAAPKAPSTLYFTDCLDSDEGDPYAQGTCTDSIGMHADLVNPGLSTSVTENYCGDDNLCHSTGWMSIAPEDGVYIRATDPGNYSLDDKKPLDPWLFPWPVYCFCPVGNEHYPNTPMVGCEGQTSWVECNYDRCYPEQMPTEKYQCTYAVRFGPWWIFEDPRNIH